MLVNPGDNVLLDAPTYPGTLAAVRAPQTDTIDFNLKHLVTLILFCF